MVTDTWFPEWSAEVDGRPGPIAIVNECVRGVFVEAAGRHAIRMRFWRCSLSVGLAATAAGLLLVPLRIRQSAPAKYFR